jgi:phospholipid/cholesterol/gamma-HCH transport system permease protein
MPTVLRRSIEHVGGVTLRVVELLGAVGLLIGETAANSPRLVSQQRGRALAWRNLWFQLYRVGVRSVGVVGLVTYCIGAILALQIGPILAEYGAASRLPDIIAIAMLRELGPLVGAIVLTGFAGASIAAELGTMAVGEEIKALKAHAISPVRFLVVPRVIATGLMTVCLAVFANAMGILGGATTSYLAMGMPVRTYLDNSFAAVEVFDLVTGLIKAGVFGTIIGALACHLGMNVRGGAQGVGNATTSTVVFSIVALACVDLLFTFVFFQLEL